MYPPESNDQQTSQTPPATTQIITLTAPIITSTDITNNYQYELSDINEDELIELLRPKSNRKEDAPYQSNYQQDELIVTTTQEINEFNLNEKQLQQQSSNTQTTTIALSKFERQRRKNMKLKWKQRKRPDFQHQIKRPIYDKF
ncbi:unnamed protein product [Rotaria sordida]|uniref:Uncharacterized protein n=1 Tax=Rotaria sordida TaxID=392033 RepID=A0A818L7H4_9BILA|nr:unnamed protein product [Rotaria sordida]CAF1540678.1 unnamed protein product [Rotaria sordida]CAF3568216.1 unnamed protein product [Rotaria sordida]CAF3636607.1 unnamed protein product [Rotaria sordida]